MKIKYAFIMMIGAQFLAALSSVLVVQLESNFPIYQLILFRQSFALIILLPILVFLFGGITVNMFRKIHLIRGLLITIGNITFLMALMHLPLVTVTAVVYSSPIILVLISASLLKEKLSRTKIASVCIGFCGILMISKPSDANVFIVLAFIGAITIALNSVCLKKTADSEHPMLTLFLSNIYTVIFIVPFAYWEQATITIPVVSTAFYLAVFYIGITYLVIHAFRRADASILAPVEYSGLVFAALFGYYLFGQTIGLWTMAGIFFVIGSVSLQGSLKLLPKSAM